MIRVNLTRDNCSPPLRRGNPKSIGAAVARYNRHYALLRFYSLGAGKRFFMGSALVVWALGGLSLAAAAGLFIVAKIMGKAEEKARIKELANLIRTNPDLGRQILLKAMEEPGLSPTVKEGLIGQLKKRGVVI